MKSERRHDLKTNSLSRGIAELPEFGRRYGNRLLLVLIFILLAIVLVRYRAQQAEQDRITASTNLTTAERAIHDLWYQPVVLMGDQAGMAKTRDALTSEAEAALETALRTAEDPKLRADAYVARGNLNWLLANFPALPAAATQPSLALPKSSTDYLIAAGNAYSEVLKDPLSRNQAALTAARLGLGAIAENKLDWKSAEQDYNDVIADAATATAIKEYTQNRLKMLTELKRPVLLAGAEHQAQISAPAVGPAFGPLGPTTAPVGPVNDPLSLTPSPSPSPAPAPTTRP